MAMPPFSNNKDRSRSEAMLHSIYDLYRYESASSRRLDYRQCKFDSDLQLIPFL